MKKIIKYFSVMFVGLPYIVALRTGYRARFMPTFLKVFKFFVNRIDVFVNIDKFLDTLNDL